MNKKHRVGKLTIKMDDDDGDKPKGSFTGHGNMFDVIDSYRDVVLPGAFTQTLEEHEAAGTMPKLLWQHDTAEPIGIYTHMSEDELGLYVEGQLAINDNVPSADKAYSLLKMGALEGLSIGYTMYPGGQHWNDDAHVLELTNIKLWETSIVTFAANEPSTVETIKHDDGELPTVREFEHFLQDVAGFSKSESKAVIANGFRSIQRDAGEDPLDQGEVDAVLATIEKNTSAMLA